MAGLYLYCILPAGHGPPAGLSGVAGAGVRGEAVDAFNVWVSDASGPPEASLEAVAQHHEVVRAAASVTPLPVRFGEWVPDRSVLATRVDESREALAAALDSVAGGVEFGVRIVEPGGPRPSSAAAAASDYDASSGRGYLRALAAAHGLRRERLRRRDRVLGALRQELGGLPRGERVQDIAPPGLVSVAHLVARSDEARYHQVVQHFGRRRPELGVHVTGPWPPYSFTT